VQELLAELSAYAAQHELEYKSVRLVLAKTPASKWDQQPSGALPAGKIFCRLYSQFYRVRHLLRAMGEAAGIDIEPASSQSLLDTTLQSRGVLLAGVPGAGGDDAIFALVMDQEAVAPLEARWADFAFPGQPDRKVQRLPVSDEKDTIRFDEASIDVGQWNLLRQ
jgi:phosphomevalonate kinase